MDGVSLSLEPGETLGLVGESGCGKSTVARLILRLVEPTAGRVRFGDVDLTALRDEPLRRQRREVQMVFQDPTASLNPRLSVRRTVEEPLRPPRRPGAGRAGPVVARLTHPKADCSNRVVVGEGPRGEPLECVCIEGTLATCLMPGP